MCNELISAIAGAILGAGLTYCGAVLLANRQFSQLKEISKLDALNTAWHVAASRFKDAFNDELSILESRDELPQYINVFLLNAYRQKHRVAIAAFEHYLPIYRRVAFKAACHQYCCSEQETNDAMGLDYEEWAFMQYSEAMAYQGGVTEPRKLAAQRIRTILEFANHEPPNKI